MARNKYPEETIQKILDVSLRLFLSKGYDKTSVQDIVNELGMSKGAIYHHFQSKAEILDHLCSRIYEDMGWMEAIIQDTTLNGLEKLRRMFLFELQNESKVSMDVVTTPLLNNPQMVLNSLRSTVQDVAPMMVRVIEKGNLDGSLQVKQPEETAEVMLLLINMWVNPGIFPVNQDRFLKKIRLYQQLLVSMGIPLVGEELVEATARYYDEVMTSRMAMEVQPEGGSAMPHTSPSGGMQ